MKQFMIIMLLLCPFGVLFGQSGTIVIPSSAEKLVNPLENNQKATMNGAKTYKKVCWVCHGDNGLGNGPQSVELEIKPADFKHKEVLDRSNGALYWWIREGGNGMQPYKDILASEQIWELVNYVRYVQKNN